MKFPKQLSDAIERNEKSIIYYYETCEALEIDELHRLQDRISTILYYISDEESKLKRDFNLTRFKREISFSRARMSYRKEHNGGDSDSLASQSVENDKMQELEIESTAYRLQTIVRRTEGVLKAINQRIATKKKEKENSDRQNS